MSLPELSLHGMSITERLCDRHIPLVMQNADTFWSPAVDISENSTEFLVYVDIPGVKSDSIDIDFFNNNIIVKGDRKRPFTDTTLSCNEIKYGLFECYITLPIRVTRRESVNIITNNGVLIISINKDMEEYNMFSMRIDSPNETTL